MVERLLDAGRRERAGSGNGIAHGRAVGTQALPRLPAGRGGGMARREGAMRPPWKGGTHISRLHTPARQWVCSAPGTVEHGCCRHGKRPPRPHPCCQARPLPHLGPQASPPAGPASSPRGAGQPATTHDTLPPPPPLPSLTAPWCSVSSSSSSTRMRPRSSPTGRPRRHHRRPAAAAAAAAPGHGQCLPVASGPGRHHREAREGNTQEGVKAPCAVEHTARARPSIHVHTLVLWREGR